MEFMEGQKFFEKGNVKFRTIVCYAISSEGLRDGLWVVRKQEGRRERGLIP